MVRPLNYPGPSMKRVYKPKRRMYSKSKAIPFRADPGFVDLASASRALDTTGSITLVATIPQGSSQNERIGKKIRYKSFQVRGTLASNSATVSTRVAFFLVYDKKPTGSLPAITDILETISSTSFTNDNNSTRFDIIRRWDYVLIGNSTNLTESSAISINSFVKFRKQAVFKSSATGAIADYDEGAVYLITVGETAAGTGAGASTLTIRTRFDDI